MVKTDLLSEHRNKVRTDVAIVIEVVVKTVEGEYKKVSIREGYSAYNDDPGFLTLYREGDEVRGGIARGAEIVQLHGDPCACAACQGFL